MTSFQRRYLRVTEVFDKVSVVFWWVVAVVFIAAYWLSELDTVYLAVSIGSLAMASKEDKR